METKLCTKCKRQLSLDSFAKNRRKTSGLQDWCRACKNGHHQGYYKKNKDKFRAISQAAIQRNREMVWEYLAEHPCQDCNEDDPVVLEFHHREETTKVGNVSEMIHACVAVEKLIAELDKCDVLCANCHRRVTAKQQGWYGRLV